MKKKLKQTKGGYGTQYKVQITFILSLNSTFFT